ncbi:MAG: hypothetical protein ACK4OO_03310 [bacterium]
MNPTAIVPELDPIPLPGPIWLLKFLLLLTFFLHLVAMNLLVGGAVQGVIARVGISHPQLGGHRKRFLEEIIGAQPTLIAATVTLGVAPLLFIQVLYGHLVYTAGIALGWFWWTVILVLILAYSLYYGLKFRRGGERAPSLLGLLVSGVALLWISFILSNKFNLAAQPERFTSLILGSSGGGHLNWADPTTFPRWLHIVIGALAVSGIGTMWRGRWIWTKDPFYGDYLLNLGYKYFSYPTMANILVGFIFMMTLPRPIMLLLMGQGFGETAMWLVGLGGAIWAILLLKRATIAPRSIALPLGTAAVAVTLISMVLLRDMVRSAYQKPYFTLAQSSVQTLWSPLMVFLVCFIIGLGVFYWLIRVYYLSPQRRG